MDREVHVLSLGAGVQSSTMALMASKGIIAPKPVAAIFADTQFEPKVVYGWLDWLEENLDFPVIRVTNGSLREHVRTAAEDQTRKTRMTSLPCYVDNGGKLGKGKKYCTNDFKITALYKAQRELLGLKKHARVPKDTKMIVWKGISTDEAARMKPISHWWQEARYPLIEMNMSRSDCQKWLMENYGVVAPRSSCIICPNHSNEYWAAMKEHSPEEFKEAVEFDHLLRKYGPLKGMNCLQYLHKSLKPLDEVDFTIKNPNAFINECEGMCGI